MLSEALQTSYRDLTLEQIAKFPLNNPKDFETIAEALRAITDTEHPNTHTVPDSLKDRVTQIQDMLQHPEELVESPENYDTFKAIVLATVAGKIDELINLTPEQKQARIDSYQEEKKIREANRQIMKSSRAPKPGDAAHVESKEDGLMRSYMRAQLGDPTEFMDCQEPDVVRLRKQIRDYVCRCHNLRWEIDHLPNDRELLHKMSLQCKLYRKGKKLTEAVREVIPRFREIVVSKPLSVTLSASTPSFARQFLMDLLTQGNQDLQS